MDACDIEEKYPDGFVVTLHVTVHSDAASNPQSLWQGFTTKGLNPKLLFSNREEQNETLRKFGTLYYLHFFFRFATLRVVCINFD